MIRKCMEEYKLKYNENNDWAQSMKGRMVCEWVDCTIYSKNRQIRMAENCKAGEPNSHLKYYDDEYSKKWPDNEDDKFYASLLTRSENLRLAKSLRFPQPKHNIFIMSVWTNQYFVCTVFYAKKAFVSSGSPRKGEWVTVLSQLFLSVA